jgi:protein phosphatase
MKTYSITDPGMVRDINEDYVFVADEPVGFLPNLFMVADGMGGHQAGDFASKYSVDAIKREILNTKEQDIEKALLSAIKVANKEIMKKSAGEDRLKGMGTTIIVTTIVSQMMYFANVGDSRLYLINQGITQLTKDHSLVEEMVRLGGIKPEEAKHHPDKNIITRAIGAKEDIEIDFYEHRLNQGDIILMCTDGLNNMVEDEEIFYLVQSGRDIVESGELLLNVAKTNGGVDNIGIVLINPYDDEVYVC